MPVCSVKDNPKLIITEIADPDGGHDARFIELYSSDSAGKTLGQIGGKDAYLVRWTNAATEATASSAIKLTGEALDANGFLVFCRNAAKFKEVWEKDSCQPAGSGGPADSNGDDHVAIVTGTPPPKTAENQGRWTGTPPTIIDIFGKPGTDGTGQDHEFEDGRAERKAAVKDAKATWNKDDWNVHSDANADGHSNGPKGATKENFDPFAWIGTSGASARGASSGSGVTPPPTADTVSAVATSQKPRQSAFFIHAPRRACALPVLCVRSYLLPRCRQSGRRMVRFRRLL